MHSDPSIQLSGRWVRKRPNIAKGERSRRPSRSWVATACVLFGFKYLSLTIIEITYITIPLQRSVWESLCQFPVQYYLLAFKPTYTTSTLWFIGKCTTPLNFDYKTVSREQRHMMIFLFGIRQLPPRSLCSGALIILKSTIVIGVGPTIFWFQKKIIR